MLDLRKAYLQIHMDSDLWRFQPVRFKGRVYVMTRMGFGLSVAPKVMTKILRKVLSLDDRVRDGTSSYIDDIIVRTDIVPVEVVRQHLEAYGLVTKEPAILDGARVLGLAVRKGPRGDYRWRRDNALPRINPDEDLTKRQLFSACGQLVSHYPRAGWLHPACSYVKRQVCDGQWDAVVPTNVTGMLLEMIQRAEADDPATGHWTVPQSAVGKVWCDASSLALGVCLDIGGHAVEDASWLRKRNDGAHINVAELEAVLKGISLAIKWGVQTLEIVTDSATVRGWVSSVIQDSRRPSVSGLGEMLIRRRLGMLTELIEAYSLNVSITLVGSSSNLADVMTRVPRKWLRTMAANDPVMDARPDAMPDVLACPAMVGIPDTGPSQSDSASMHEEIQRLHNLHHLGVKRTLHLARRRIGHRIRRRDVRAVIDECQVCRSIDPAPAHWDQGTLAVAETWRRVASDITHTDGHPYLTMVDCGPGRYAIWRKLTNESGASVASQLQSIFAEMGAPSQFLSDNGPCFRSQDVQAVLGKWTVSHLYSCAYRPAGNGIVERNHRTIKRMVARSRGCVSDMVYWYNNSPNVAGIVPSETVFVYAKELSTAEEGAAVQGDESGCNPYAVGDTVYVKPSKARCSTPWDMRVVTAILSPTAVEIGGIPRHVADVRLVSRVGLSGACDDSLVDGNRPVDAGDDSLVDGNRPVDAVGTERGGRCTRARRAPAYLSDYAVG